MSEEIETVELTLKLPKPIVDYYSYGNESVDERLVWELVEKALSQIEATDANTVMERFNLKPVFKQFDMLPGYYKEAEKDE